MKKIKYIFLIIISFFLVACGKATLSSTDLVEVIETIACTFTRINGVVQKNVPAAERNPECALDKYIPYDPYNDAKEDDIRPDFVQIGIYHSEAMNNLFYDYTLADFPEFEFESLSHSHPERLEEIREAALAGEAVTKSNWVYLDSYARTIDLKLKNPSIENAKAAVAALQTRDDIGYATCIHYHTFELFTDNTPDDTYFSSQSLEEIYVPDAWDYSTGSNLVKVGIIDTGILGSHYDLSPNLNTTISTGLGWFEQNPTSNLAYKHGTRVAGIIGAKGNNGIGISGICQNITLVSIRVDDEDSPVLFDVIGDAINYATQNSIPILNISLGTDDSYYYYDMYTAIQSYPGLVVCAAGNSNWDLDTHPIYPASIDLPNIIAVGGTDENNNKKDNSNYGLTSVDLFAPYYSYTTSYGTSYAPEYSAFNGTSASAPYVTGVAALLLSYWPSLTTQQIKNSILNNVDVMSSLSGYCVTGGKLNAYEAFLNMDHTHVYNYYNLGATTGHNAVCKHNTCLYTTFEEHSWAPFLDMYKCTKCRCLANFIPIIHDSINPNIRNVIDFEVTSKMLSQYIYKYDEHIGIMYQNGSYYIIVEVDDQGRYIEDIPSCIYNMI